MISLLVAGKLVGKPQARVSKNDNSYVRAQILAAADGETFLCSLVAFSEEACRKLLALDRGDSVCAAGNGKPTGWTGKDGSPAVGLSLVVNEVLTAYALKQKRAASEGGESLLPAVSPLARESDGDDAAF